MTHARSALALAVALLLGVSLSGAQSRLRFLTAQGGGGGGSFSTTWSVESTGYVTVGLVAPEGQLPATDGVQVGSFTTQTDVLNTWPSDGSIRHAIVSFNATSTGAKAVAAITHPGGSHTPKWPSASVAFAITAGPGSGSTYTATLPSFTGTNCTGNGAVMRRCWVLVTPETGGAVAHDNLQVIFEVTSYNGSGHQVGVGIQNIRNVATMDKVTANVTTTVAGSGCTAMTKSAWTIYSGQRWYRTCLTSLTTGSVASDAGFWEPWIDANVLPRLVATGVDTQDYFLTSGCDNWALGGGTSWGGASCNDFLRFGAVQFNQGDSENTGRDELTPIPDYVARWITLGNTGYRDTVLQTANQSGGWSQSIDKAGDGQSILRLDEDSNHVNVLLYPGFWLGINWPNDGTCGKAGVFHGGCSTSGAANVNDEHLPESNFHAYLYTGEKFYLDQMRFQASWVAFFPASGYSEADTYRWSGYFRGRNGVEGYQNWSEMGRSFGRPMRLICRTAWALPDTYALTDYAYFHDLCENQLEAIATYMTYLDSRGWDDAPYLAVGMGPTTNGSATWQFARSNSISSTTAGNPTVLVVIGDDSATCAGASACNDHDVQTGDYVDISGISASGATALNGEHVGPATRINATSFSLPINTTGSSSGEGTWRRVTAPYFAHWRAMVTGWETSWTCFTGLWTCSAATLAFPDKLAQAAITLTGGTNYATAPGYFHNFYTSPGVYRGNNLSLFTTVDAWATANDRTLNTAALIESEAIYAGFAGSHRGQLQWNESNPNTFYTPYATTMLVHGIRRSLSGASAAYTAVVSSASGQVQAELEARPGFYWETP